MLNGSVHDFVLDTADQVTIVGQPGAELHLASQASPT
jgi:hypothetical protein